MAVPFFKVDVPYWGIPDQQDRPRTCLGSEQQVQLSVQIPGGAGDLSSGDLREERKQDFHEYFF